MMINFFIFKSGSSASYRPVYSRGEDGEFTRIPSPVVLQLDVKLRLEEMNINN